MANYFGGSSDCVAVHRYDLSGFLVDDSIGGTNTLTNNNSATQSTDAQQGDRSLNCVRASSQWGYRTDGNLSSDFPGKGGTSNLDLTSCFWTKLVGTIGSTQFLVTKWNASVKSFLTLYNANLFRVTVGNGGSTQATYLDSTFAPSINIWYHISFTYNSSTDIMTLRILNSSLSVLTNVSTTATTSMGVSNGIDYATGGWDGGNNPLDGRIDECVLFNTSRSITDTDNIAAGTFTEASSNIPIFMNHYMRH